MKQNKTDSYLDINAFIPAIELRTSLEKEVSIEFACFIVV